MSLCIAATCRHEDEPCIVHCGDTAGTRGDVKSEDIIKIRNVGQNTVLLAGNMSDARELLAACTPAIQAYEFGGDEIAITKLKQGLTEAVRLRKRAMSTAVLSAELGVTYDEVFNWSQAHPADPIWIQAWATIRGLHLGAALVISTFTDDEAALLVIEPDGRVVWADHYAAVGTGNNVASAFLAQRDYSDGMDVEECLYRVLEAKTAAEKNPYVGKATYLEFRSPNANHHLVPDYIERMASTIRKRREKRLKFTIDPKYVSTTNPMPAKEGHNKT